MSYASGCDAKGGVVLRVQAQRVELMVSGHAGIDCGHYPLPMDEAGLGENSIIRRWHCRGCRLGETDGRL